MEPRPLTAEELVEIHARPTRYFLDDSSGTLYRFAHNPDEFHARFNPDRDEWVADRSAEEFVSRGGYMTEITSDEAASLHTREDGRALLAALPADTRPFLGPGGKREPTEKRDTGTPVARHQPPPDAPPTVPVHTIGFTKKTAERFFELLESTATKRLIDVRLNNVSQLSGFAKKDDLKFFLQRIAGIEYLHLPILAPTKAILDDYTKGGKDWDLYEQRFLDLMAERAIEDHLSPDLLANSCLLCSEDQPHHCHRRLVAEYLQNRWGSLTINHLT